MIESIIFGSIVFIGITYIVIKKLFAKEYFRFVIHGNNSTHYLPWMPATENNLPHIESIVGMIKLNHENIYLIDTGKNLTILPRDAMTDSITTVEFKHKLF